MSSNSRKFIKEAIGTDGKWKKLESQYLFQRPWLTVRRDKVELPDGRTNDEFYVLEYPDWVNVIAITKNGQFVMERQYRHGIGVTCYEICAGVIEQGESPLEAAKRELLEEAQVLSLLENNRITQSLMAAPLWSYFYNKSRITR